MHNFKINEQVLDTLADIARLAGDEIMAIYGKDDHGVKYKADESPLTLADTASHEIIVNELSTLTPDIPIVSEEGTENENRQAFASERYWLIDPLDGTKEFIKRNDQFTVNIALIDFKVPVVGVVYAPALNEMFIGATDIGAFKIDKAGRRTKIGVSNNQEVKTVAVSRSHLDEKTESLIKKLAQKPKLISSGSSIKMCFVANGRADLYPRFAPTMEWDTGAGDAIIRAAGGRVIDLSGNDFVYSKKEHRNSGFICLNSKINISELIE